MTGKYFLSRLFKFIISNSADPHSTGVKSSADSLFLFGSPTIPFPAGAAAASQVSLDQEPLEDRVLKAQSNYFLWQFENIFLSGLVFSIFATVHDIVKPTIIRPKQSDLPRYLQQADGLRLIPSFLDKLIPPDVFSPGFSGIWFKKIIPNTKSRCVNSLLYFLSSDIVLKAEEEARLNLVPSAANSMTASLLRLSNPFTGTGKISNFEPFSLAHAVSAGKKWATYTADGTDQEMEKLHGLPIEKVKRFGETPVTAMDTLIWITDIF
ncbi:hypothetical protein RCL1_004463 [Eukaryota sp. TZLM3-RCL]